MLIVRPTLALGRLASNVFERVVIDGVAQGATRAVRAGNSVVRVAQSGLLRYYALLLMTGVTALALYFLIVASRKRMLSVLIFLPLLGGLVAALWPGDDTDGGRRRGFMSLLFATATLGIAIGLIADFDYGPRARDHVRERRRRDGSATGSPARHRRHVDLAARHPLQARRRRPQPVPDRAHRAALGRRHHLVAVPRMAEGAQLLPDAGARARPPRSAPSAPRTSRCSSCSSI